MLAWEPGFKALEAVSHSLTTLTDFTNEGTSFVFGGLLGEDFIFALNVLLGLPANRGHVVELPSG